MEYNYTFDNNIYNNGPMLLDNNTSYEYIIDNLDKMHMKKKFKTKNFSEKTFNFIQTGRKNK